MPRAFRRSARAARDADLALRRALLAVLDRDYDAAEELITRAVRIDSDDVDAYLALARLFRTRGEVGRAIRIHQNVLLRSDLAGAGRVAVLAELGADFQEGGFLRRAIAAYQEVLDADAKHARALRALGRLFAEVRDYKRAIEMERRLARVERRDAAPIEAELLVSLAADARAAGGLAEARRALKRAMRRDPASAAPWVELGELEAERGRTRAALAAWRRAPEIDPRCGPQVYEKLAAAFAADGDARAFERFLLDLLERRPNDAAARLALARALAARGDTDGAVAALRRVLERDPEDVEARCALGRVLLAAAREEDAAKSYAELLDVIERRGFHPVREGIE